jgi:hypothetical protein
VEWIFRVGGTTNQVRVDNFRDIDIISKSIIAVQGWLLAEWGRVKEIPRSLDSAISIHEQSGDGGNGNLVSSRFQNSVDSPGECKLSK